jgi:hypothetical protein
MSNCIIDAPDYIGGQPVAGRIMVVDAGGRWTQVPPGTAVPGSFLTGTISIAGLRVESVLSTTAAALGFFVKTPIVQQALLAATDIAIASNSLTGMDVIAAAFVSTNKAINSINLFMRNYGLQSTG